MVWMLSLLALSRYILSVDAGCWQGRPHCCPGRNMSCASFEMPQQTYGSHSSGSHSGSRPDAVTIDVSFNPTIEEIAPFRKPYHTSIDFNEEGSGDEVEDTFIVNPAGSSRAPSFIDLYQSPLGSDPDDDTEDFSGVGWARLMSYEVIEMPFATSGDKMVRPRFDRSTNGSKHKIGQMCYCDEDCTVLDDCCSDYQAVCPTRDCRMSTWSAWSECKPLTDTMYSPARSVHPHKSAQDNHEDCSRGIRRRHRLVTHAAENGGKPCLHSIEEKVCPVPEVGQCRKVKDEVAIILPYRFSSARLGSYRSDLYYDHPNDVAELNELRPSCSTFVVAWISPHCLNSDVARQFQVGSSICAECQPRAQYPHHDKKCAGDSVFGQAVPWMLSGDTECRGLWNKQTEDPGCTCGDQTVLPAYILV